MHGMNSFGPEDDSDQTSDDRDLGWGDDVREEAAKDTDEWYLAERPPHHGT